MDKIRIKTTSCYENFIGMFATVERKNGKKAVGILYEITCNTDKCNMLHIKGKYMTWIFDENEVADFAARPDKYSGGDYH